MKKLIFIMIVFLSVLFSGCSLGVIDGSDTIVPVELDFVPKDFTRVAVATSISAAIVKADTYGISITANDNLVEYLDVSQEDGILRMELTDALVSFTNVQVEAVISMPDCSHVAASTSGTVTIDGFSNTGMLGVEATTSASIHLGAAMNSANLSIIASASGQIRGTVYVAETIFVDASTSGIVQLSGSANNADVTGSSSAKIDIEDLPAARVDVELSTSAQAVIHVTDLLNVNLSTSGVCSYRGNPDFGTIIINTSAKLINLN